MGVRIATVGWLAAMALVPVACSGPEDRTTAPPTWSIETAEVVFTARRDGLSDLYVLRRQTGEARRLTSVGTADGGANAPRVSPDGRSIAFQVRRGADYEIHVMDLPGGTSRNLTNHPEYDVNPTWSPDGDRLAFMSTRGFELGSIGPFPGHIYVRPLSSDSLQQVTRQPLTSSFGPSDWSPDGATLLMARSDDSGTDVYGLDIATGSEARLTSGAGAEYSAVYAHSGDRIAFHSESDGTSQIMVLDLGTGQARAVTSGPGLRYSPQWSPDDAWLMFTASDDGRDYDLRAVHVSDGRVIDIVATSEDEREGQWLPSTRLPDPLIAVHLASREPHAGWEGASFEGRDLFLEPEPVVVDVDIADVAATRSEEGVLLDVQLTEAGAERLRRVTAEHVGDPLALMFESRVVSAPVIRSAIAGGRVQMAVPASAEEAARIVERIRSRWPEAG